jgi:hypothetical protein
MRTRRNLGFRLGTALAGLVFFASSGVTGVEMHPLSHYDPPSTALVTDGQAPAPVSVSEVEAVPESQAPTAGHEHHAAHPASRAGHGAPTGTPAEAGEVVAVAASAPSHSAHHGAGQECTCVGVCHSGASPTPPNVVTSVVVSGEIVLARIPMRAPLVVFEDPSSYLFPLPNAPPNHA